MTTRLWLPSDAKTATLAGWFDAQDASSFTLTASNGVSEWRSKAGGTWSVLQSDTTKQPTRNPTGYNNLPAVMFTSSSVMSGADGMLTPAGSQAGIQSGVAAVVSNGPDYATLYTQGNRQPGQLRSVSAHNRSVSVGYFGNDHDGTTGWTGKDRMFVCSIDTTGLSKIYVDGVATPETKQLNPLNTPDNSPFYIGAGINGDPWQNPIQEITDWTGLLSTAEQDMLFGYYAWRWNLVASLPANHPYKNAAPTIDDGTGGISVGSYGAQSAASTSITALSSAAAGVVKVAAAAALVLSGASTAPVPAPTTTASATAPVGLQASSSAPVAYGAAAAVGVALAAASSSKVAGPGCVSSATLPNQASSTAAVQPAAASSSAAAIAASSSAPVAYGATSQASLVAPAVGSSTASIGFGGASTAVVIASALSTATVTPSVAAAGVALDASTSAAAVSFGAVATAQAAARGSALSAVSVVAAATAVAPVLASSSAAIDFRAVSAATAPSGIVANTTAAVGPYTAAAASTIALSAAATAPAQISARSTASVPLTSSSTAAIVIAARGAVTEVDGGVAIAFVGDIMARGAAAARIAVAAVARVVFGSAASADTGVPVPPIYPLPGDIVRAPAQSLTVRAPARDFIVRASREIDMLEWPDIYAGEERVVGMEWADETGDLALTADDVTVVGGNIRIMEQRLDGTVHVAKITGGRGPATVQFTVRTPTEKLIQRVQILVE